MRRKMRLLIVAATMVCAGAIGLVSQQAFVANDTIELKSVQGDSALDITKTQVERSWPWYVTRASGLVAGICLIIMMLSGVGLVTGHTFKFLEPLTAWATHRALGITFVVAIIAHMVALLFDKFVPFTIPELLVPWLSHYKPVTVFGQQFGSLYVALGILAFYIALLIVLTSLFWIDKKQKTWKLTHLMSYAVVALVFFHALFLGTDTGNGWLMWVWIAAGVGVMIAALARIKRIGQP